MLKWSTGCSESPSVSLHIPARQNAHSTERGRSERSVEACGGSSIETLNSNVAGPTLQDLALIFTGGELR
jgi:hypothetical protein